MIRQQLKTILKDKKQLLPLLAILFIPIMYTGMFLWAFWDPYAQLHELPVAIVNEDQGAEFEEQTLQLGDELLTKLEDRQDFKFKAFTRQQAENALADKEVYMVLEIPENFSQNATTLLSETPETMELIYRPNEAFNFLSSQIGETAVARIQATVNKEVTATFTEGLYEAITSLGDGLAKASDGSSELEDGAVQLQQGTSDLKSYLDQLAQGSVTLTDGATQLASGISDAHQGSATLTTKLGDAIAGAESATSGSIQISDGASSLQQGIVSYTSAVNELSTGAQSLSQGELQFTSGLSQAATSSAQLTSGLNDLANGANELAKAWEQTITEIAATLPEEQAATLKAQVTPLLQATSGYSDKVATVASGSDALTKGLSELEAAQIRLATASEQLADGTITLNSSSSKLVDGSSMLAEGSEELATKLPELVSGLSRLQEGSATLTTGLAKASDAAGRLSTGSSTLSSSSQQIADGADRLNDGSEKLTTGVKTLHSGLEDGAQEASAFKAGTNSVQAVAQPIQVEKAAVHEVPNYGTGFSPYFISLGLFVGALLTSIVFPLRDPASTPTSGLRWYASKTIVVVAVGILQALIASALTIWLVGVDPINPVLFVAGAILTSLTFMALVQVLVTTLGDTGRFVAIILLILQLTTSAGTFPLELLPKALQVFNSWLPMTYSVDLFKSAISIEGAAGFNSAAGVLVGFTLALSAATLLYFMRLFQKQKPQ
ncbi:YhgE/Pip domain-containing protein [Chryseomicrobium palamuruense]